MRLLIKEAFVAERYTMVTTPSEDGPITQLFDNVVVQTVCGRHFLLDNTQTVNSDMFGPVRVRRYQNAGKVTERVRRFGSIDPAMWMEQFPEEAPTLEEKLGEFGIEWQREQEDRGAWG